MTINSAGRSGTNSACDTSARRTSALLLDTHVWLWYAEGVADRLRPASVRKLEEARRGDGLLVLAISVWEIGMHAAVAAESALLPGEPQGDPADRFLIATARTHGVALATRDEGILAYAKQGFLRAVRI